MARDVDIRGKLLTEPDLSVLFETEDGIQAWLPCDQIAIVHDVECVVVTMPQRMAIAKGIY